MTIDVEAAPVLKKINFRKQKKDFLEKKIAQVFFSISCFLKQNPTSEKSSFHFLFCCEERILKLVQVVVGVEEFFNSVKCPTPISAEPTRRPTFFRLSIVGFEVGPQEFYFN